MRLLLGEWLGSGVTCAIWCVAGALRLLGRACVPAGLLWLWCCPVVGCRFRGPWVALGFPFGGGLRVTLLAWCSAPAGGGLWVTRVHLPACVRGSPAVGRCAWRRLGLEFLPGRGPVVDHRGPGSAGGFTRRLEGALEGGLRGCPGGGSWRAARGCVSCRGALRLAASLCGPCQAGPGWVALRGTSR